MVLLRRGELVEDRWQKADDVATADGGSFLLYSLEQWQSARDRFRQSNAPLGLWLRSDQAVREIASDIPLFAVIALEFPKFTDGRPYSTARLLRERHRFQGELRAVGQVLRDQLTFMARCGFDSFALPENADAEAWAASFREFSHWYQVASDDRTPVARLRARRQAVAS